LEDEMQIEDYFDFFADGDIRIKGHRIGIEDVLYEHLCNGFNAEELAARFPTLGLEQIYATLLYYLHNKEKISQYITDWIEHGKRMRELQEMNPPPAILKLREIAAARQKKAAFAEIK
jgi:uncharacterized protein (DUF433 family)